MVDYRKLREEDMKERMDAIRGSVELTDYDNTHVETIMAVASDNGAVKCIRLGNVNMFDKGAIYIQGTMMQELANLMYNTFGIKAKKKR